MLEQLRESWREFRDSEPGSRFEDWHARRKRHGRGRFDPKRIGLIALGILVMLGGIFLLAAPGPGWLTVFFGLGLLASEFRSVARFMDRGELRGRRLADRLLAFWNRASVPLRTFLVFGTLLLAGLAGYAAYAVVFA